MKHLEISVKHQISFYPKPLCNMKCSFDNYFIILVFCKKNLINLEANSPLLFNFFTYCNFNKNLEFIDSLECSNIVFENVIHVYNNIH